MLIDSSFLAALNAPGDPFFRRAQAFVEINVYVALAPDVVLTEVEFLVNRAGGLPALLKFLDRIIANSVLLQPIERSDLSRARQIMAAYPTARLDFVDCCIMALAERLNITHICTFDRRDFSIVRPAHCDYFELLP
ncbi:MAG: type II toxin-antitoxin system VapC family toxin [Aggregatilineales bacterium]